MSESLNLKLEDFIDGYEVINQYGETIKSYGSVKTNSLSLIFDVADGEEPELIFEYSISKPKHQIKREKNIERRRHKLPAAP